MSDGPYDWKENGAAAQQIHEEEDVVPGTELGVALIRLVRNDLGHVGQNLRAKKSEYELHCLLFLVFRDKQTKRSSNFAFYEPLIVNTTSKALDYRNYAIYSLDKQVLIHRERDEISHECLATKLTFNKIFLLLMTN